MDNTPDINGPGRRCQRYTCRCTETENVQALPTIPSEPIDWTPWMAARAANA